MARWKGCKKAALKYKKKCPYFPKSLEIKIKVYLPTHFSEEEKPWGNKILFLWCLI